MTRGRGAQNREHQTKRAEDEEGKRSKFVENKELRTENTRMNELKTKKARRRKRVENKDHRTKSTRRKRAEDEAGKEKEFRRKGKQHRTESMSVRK